MAQNPIHFGLKNVHYALATDDGYATPVALKGGVGLTLDPEGDTTKIYADDNVWFTSVTNDGYTGTLELMKIDKEALVDLLGYEIDAGGQLVEFADAQPREFVMMYEAEGEPTHKRGQMFSVKLGRPKEEHKTTEGKVESQTLSFDFTAVGKEITWGDETRYAVKSSVETGDADYADFFKAVKLPTKVSA